ncbi:class I SAM-dependent methyltransferase [Paraliomyxa miuraensis]|uniref:class I SAM-dependent methyltransferase n=1 Tax=Paraliomyxa miuraensis TaxID=376150 RepID=UPI00224D1FD6|nr:methyltransferase [Paraliomyxa miuraensis]MCX4242262.1 methyltransferase [Paraliomyxa miuraensis]
MRRLPSSLLAVALLACLSCSKDPPPSDPPASGDAPPATDAPAAQTDDLPPQLAAQLRRQEARAKEISARFTPELQAELDALVSAGYPTPEAALDAILASPHRAPGNADRDRHRHPKETLVFFGLRQDMKVFEYAQGAGWYTEILAPFLAKQGTLYLTGYDGTSEDPQQRYGARAVELFLTAPGNLYAKVQTVTQPDLQAPPVLGQPDSLDMVLVIRMMHNVHRAGMWDRLMPAIHQALKPGGVLGVVQHRATDDADPDQSAPKGYLPEPWLVQKVEGYGFRLDARSDVNANPKDTKDYDKGVWTLPPTLQLGETDRAKYEAIGESDRSTLRFVKVAEGGA